MDSELASETSLRPKSLLLGVNDIDPVFEQNAGGRSPFLFTSDHYGRLIPKPLGDLGLPESELVRHIAWDIGIAGVAERLSKLLDAHLIAQRYSRLVIDCNRPIGAASSIPLFSEATTIPGNENLLQEDRDRREVVIATTRSGDSVEVAVSDSGGGIAADVANKLFSPFVTTKPRGLGLGLAICRTIVENHGGRLWATSPPTAGASFRFSLPLAGAHGNVPPSIERAS